MKRYDRKGIMHAAWRIFRRGAGSFSAALRMAWENAKAHNRAKAAAGIREECRTWAAWRAIGYEVAHDSKALFKAALHDPTTKSGMRTVCYFGLSQVKPA